MNDANARALICGAPGKGWTTQYLTRGKLRLRVADRVKIRILAKGHRRGSLDDVGANEVIQLERASEVRFQVRWPLEIPDGLAPQIQLTPRNSYYAKTGIAAGKPSQATRLLWESHVECFIKSDCTAVVRPAILGTHSVFIEIKHRGRTHLLLPSPRVMEVTGKETEAIVLEVSEKQLLAILQQIEKR